MQQDRRYLAGRLSKIDTSVVIFLILALGVTLRVFIPDASRDILPGDELTYQNAAISLEQEGIIVREPFKDLQSNYEELPASSVLAPGYPVFVAAIYKLFPDELQSVTKAQILLSILSLYLIFLILRELGVRPFPLCIGLLAAAVYPGFMYNLDRMLTEQVFQTFLIATVYLTIKITRSGKLSEALLLGVVAGGMVHVRAQGLPVFTLALGCILLVRSLEKAALIKLISCALAGFILAMLPWWVHSVAQFGEFSFLPGNVSGPKIWGAVPYFLDMPSTADKSLEEVIEMNRQPNPDVYRNWKIFGSLQFMWGSIWDENFRHSHPFLRNFNWMQFLVVVPALLLSPLLAMFRDIRIVLIGSIPFAVTVMTMLFHGLPRYVYPSIPFIFISLALLVQLGMKSSRRSNLHTDELSHEAPKNPLHPAFGRIVFYGFGASTAVIAILIAYSVYIFAWQEETEMSEYRLAKYAGTSISKLSESKEVLETKLSPEDFSIANVEPAPEKGPNWHVTGAIVPAVARLNAPLPAVDAAGTIITKVELELKVVKNLANATTVYWTTTNNPEFSEDRVYGRFPVNFLEDSHVVYMEGDVKDLMIVPALLTGSEFQLSSITVTKYSLGTSVE